MITRPIDQRRRRTQFIKDVREVVTTISRHGLVERGLSIVTQAHAILRAEGGPRFRTYDSAEGVLVVVAGLADYPAQASRILGRQVDVVHADHFGVIYQAKED